MSLDETETRKSNTIWFRPLPPVENDAPLDALGFTGTERAALRRAWLYIRGSFYAHCNLINCEYFVKNEELLDRFRDKHGRFNLSALNRHPRSMSRIYEIIIENLETPKILKSILKDMDIRHERTGLTREQLTLYMEAVKEYQLKLLAQHTSVTLVRALNKLADIINNVRA